MTAVTPINKAATKPAPKMGVRRGKISVPRRLAVYGPPGVGKTTLVGDVPGVVVFDLEGGTESIDLPRFYFRDEKMGYIPRDLEEFRAGLRWLLTEPHDYKAIGLDTMDKLEELILRFICKRDQVDNVEGYGFGKGWVAFVDEFRTVLQQLDLLRERRGMHVIGLVHAKIVKHSDPAGGDWDRWTMKLHDKVVGLFIEWCHEIGFVHFVDKTTKASKWAKAKGLSKGERIIEFDRSATWDAKTRLALPPTVKVGIESPWAPIQDAIDRVDVGADELVRLIGEELARIGDDELRPKVEESITKAAGNVSTLSKYLHGLRRRDAVEPSAAAPTSTDVLGGGA